MRARYRAAAALAAVLAAAASLSPARAALAPPQRAVLERYLGALQRGDFEVAFRLLTPDERHYFRSAKNLAAVFAADRLHLDGFTVLGSTAVSSGVVALVRERVRFFDHAHQIGGAATANVRYGIVGAGPSAAIKDPYHPWFAFAPADVAATVDRVRIAVRKVSFYTGRMEIVVTFANLGDSVVTLLPYGRSVVRDDAGGSHTPLAAAALVDRPLYEGLRLPPSGQYTGALTFTTPDRFAPKRLAITIAPALRDGADAPFELALPALAVPADRTP